MSIRVKQRQVWSSDIKESLLDELLYLHENVDYVRKSVASRDELPYPEVMDGVIRLVREEKAIYQWVEDTMTWEKISSSANDNQLGSAFFREVHNVVPGQELVPINATMPFVKEHLMVYLDGVLLEPDVDYEFMDTKNIRLLRKPSEAGVALFILPAITEEIRAASESVYEYDEKQNVTKVTQTGDINRITEYSYDENDNVLEEKVTDVVTGEVKIRSYTYDENNNVQTVVDEGVDIIYIHKVSNIALDYYRDIVSHKITYLYDEKNRVKTEIYTGGITRKCEYYYNALNQMTTKITFENNLKITENFIYDDLGRVSQKEMTVLRLGGE